MSEGRPHAPVLALVPLAWALLFFWGWHQAPDSSPEATRFFMRSLGAARPGASPATVLAAPWLHGDPAHLGSNLLGWVLLAPFVPAAPLLLALGALVGSALAFACGPASLGPSGGIFALAGALVRDPEAKKARTLGLAWLALGLLGGLLDPTVDQRAHLVGALLGLALGPRLASWSPPPARRAGLPALALAGILAVLAAGGPAKASTEAHRPELEALALARGTLEGWVAWQARRQETIGRFLDTGQDPAGLCTALVPPPELVARRQTAIAALGALRKGLGVPASLAFGALAPATSDPGWTPSLDESSRAGWKAFWAALDRERAALAAAGDLTGALALRLFALPD